MILLGNLSISQIEKRLGITLKEEERSFLESTNQKEANMIAPGKWHCFDIPFAIVCGDREIAEKIRRILAPYSEKMKDTIQIMCETESKRKRG